MEMCQYLPFLLLLPLSSAIVTLTCDDREQPGCLTRGSAITC